MKRADIPHLRPTQRRLPGRDREEPVNSRGSFPASGKGGALYVKAGGRVYKITPQAVEKYFREYGLDECLPSEREISIGHLVEELEIALQSEPVSVGVSGRMVQYHSPSLNFKMVGSKIVNIRISLRYYATGEDDDSSDVELAS